MRRVRLPPVPKYLCADGVFRFPNGREVCQLTSKLGRDAYINRKRVMWERQGRICCLYGFIPECLRDLYWKDAAFAHEVPCGQGGGSRDDRVTLPDGRRLNGAAHRICNMLQGSRRIGFNDAFNATIRREIKHGYRDRK